MEGKGKGHLLHRGAVGSAWVLVWESKFLSLLLRPSNEN